MKKLAQTIRKIILGIGIVVMAVFYTLISVIQTPFRAWEYRKSRFARETGADYEAGVTESVAYHLYNRLRTANIAIEVLCHPKHSRDAHLLWRDTLIIHEIDRVSLRDGRWVIGSGSSVWKEGLDLRDAIAEVLEKAFDDRPGYNPENAVLLLDRRNIPAADHMEAELMPMFLLYDDEENRFEVLKTFCK